MVGPSQVISAGRQEEEQFFRHRARFSLRGILAAPSIRHADRQNADHADSSFANLCVIDYESRLTHNLYNSKLPKITYDKTASNPPTSFGVSFFHFYTF